MVDSRPRGSGPFESAEYELLWSAQVISSIPHDFSAGTVVELGNPPSGFATDQEAEPISLHESDISFGAFQHDSDGALLDGVTAQFDGSQLSTDYWIDPTGLQRDEPCD